jgi:hypothetical protein
LAAPAAAAAAAGRTQDEQISDLLSLLVQKYKLLQLTERKFKKPKPGKKKLVKWPRTLGPAPAVSDGHNNTQLCSNKFLLACP